MKEKRQGCRFSRVVWGNASPLSAKPLMMLLCLQACTQASQSVNRASSETLKDAASAKGWGYLRACVVVLIRKGYSFVLGYKALKPDADLTS